MSYGEDYHYLPVTSIHSGEGTEAAHGLYVYTVQIVNVAFAWEPGGDGWTLVDAGMPGSAEAIVRAAEEWFGEGCRPRSIVLTHGHFDHVGALIELIDRWDVPVYAHEDELPYLTGRLAYPPGDPTVDPGLVAKLSPWFPNEPVDLGGRVHALPADGHVPTLPGWTWLHTPGHTPGHVSLFKEEGRLLIAGDAFVAVRQEAVYDVFLQKPELSGPPRYFTMDWWAAWESVKRLEALKPTVAVTGHGVAMSGEQLARDLRELAEGFDRLAVPKKYRM